jgi:hypothetical protein
VLLVAHATPSQYFSEVVQFEIVESDVEDVQIRAQRGVSLKGRAVLDGQPDPALQARLLELRLSVFSRPANPSVPSVGTGLNLNSDGSFQVSSLAPGFIWFSAAPGSPDSPSFYFLRLEVDGVPQKYGVEVAAGQELHNLRLVFAPGYASVQGQVQIVGGTLPEGARLTVSARRTDGQNVNPKSVQVDARGHFTLAGLVAGEYELTLEATPDYAKGPSPILPRTLSQTIIVPAAGEVPVGFTLELRPRQ